MNDQSQTADAADGLDYFFQVLGKKRSTGAVCGEEWPLYGIVVNGTEMSRLERGLYGLTGVLELLHANSLATTAVHAGHVDANGTLGDNLAERLEHAACVLAWDAFMAVTSIYERTEMAKHSAREAGPL